MLLLICLRDVTASDHESWCKVGACQSHVLRVPEMGINGAEMTIFEALSLAGSFSLSPCPFAMIPVALESLTHILSSFIGDVPDPCNPESLRADA